MTTVRTDVSECAQRVLAGASTAVAADAESEPDWGVPLLAGLIAAEDAPAVAVAWAARHRSGNGHPGLFARGMAGTALGFRYAAGPEPRLERLADAAQRSILGWAEHAQHRRGDVAYNDYDLIQGASGVALALAALPRTRPDQMRAIAAYLADLADDPELPRLRIGNDGGMPRTRWNIGRINHGLGHGVPGVLAGLLAAWPLLAEADRDRVAAGIGNIAGYLLRNHRRDDRSVLTWSFASEDVGPPSAAHRQAWCYGTSGVAWQLAEAGRVLGDPELAEFGAAAMASLCASWDDDYYLDDTTVADRLSFCHGAAGNLAIADAFALHTGLEPAARLAEHLDGLLHRELDAVRSVAAGDLSMLGGATGILAVLLSRDPERRGWLGVVGLR